MNRAGIVFTFAGSVFALGALASWEGCSSFEAASEADASALDATVVPADGAPDDGAAADGTDATDATDARPAEALLVAQIDGGALGGVFAAGPGGPVWSVDRTLWSLTPLGVPTLTYTSPDAITPHVVVSLADLFASRPESNALVRCPLGAACTSPVPTTGLEGSGPLALHAGNLFIAELAGARNLLMCPATACVNPVPLFSPLSMPVGIVSIAAAASHVIALGNTGVITSYPQGAAGVDLKAAGTVAGIATDGVNAYWIDAAVTPAKLVRNPLGAPNSPVTSTFSVPTARDLVRDGDRLYWLESASGTVRRCKLPDFTEPQVVWTRASASRMALGDRIYLAEDSTGSIYAVPKP